MQTMGGLVKQGLAAAAYWVTVCMHALDTCRGAEGGGE